MALQDKPSYEDLERRLVYVTKERDNLKSKLSSLATLADILMASYKSALVTLSVINPNYPCVNCGYRTSVTTCKRAEVCKGYSEWKWKLMP